MKYELKEECVICKKGKYHLVWDELTQHQKIAVEHVMSDQDEVCEDCLETEVLTLESTKQMGGI